MLKRALWIVGVAAMFMLVACEADEDTGSDASTADATTDTGTVDVVADTGIAPISTRDLTVNMDGMDPHVGNLMEFRVVDSSGAVSARAYLDTLAVASASLFMPNAVPEGDDYTLDFTADLSGNGSYDAPPTDHAWQEALPDGSAAATVSFSHNTSFVDIGAALASSNGNFTLSFTGMDPHDGQLLELRVINTSTTQTVGLYMLQEVPGAAFDIEIPGIIEAGHSYQVDFYADLDGSTFYNAPPTDHAWRLTGEGTASGLSLTFAHNTDFEDVGF